MKYPLVPISFMLIVACTPEITPPPKKPSVSDSENSEAKEPPNTTPSNNAYGGAPGNVGENGTPPNDAASGATDSAPGAMDPTPDMVARPRIDPFALGRTRVFILAGQSNAEGHVPSARGQELIAKSSEGAASLAQLIQSYYRADGDYRFGFFNQDYARTVAEFLAAAPEIATIRALPSPYGKTSVQVNSFLYSARGDGEQALKPKPVFSGPLGFGFGVNDRSFGPEFTLGHALDNRFEDPVVIVKVAEGGADLHQKWRPPSVNRNAPYDSLFGAMLANIEEVMGPLRAGGRNPEIAGFFWFQGFNDKLSDEFTAGYENNLRTLISDLRRQLKTPKLPVVIAQSNLQAVNQSEPNVLDAQKAVADGDENVAMIATKDLSNFYHYGAGAFLVAGVRMGRAMIDLVEKSAPPPMAEMSEMAQNGARLYQQLCLGCHGPLAESEKIGANVGRIINGLRADVMRHLVPILDQPKMRAIAAALDVGLYPANQPPVRAHAPYRPYQGANIQAQVTNWINNHRQTSPPNSTRYVYLTDEILANPEHANLARVCLSRAINSLALRNPAIINPQDVSNGHGVVYAIDINEYLVGNAQEKWSGAGFNDSVAVDHFARNVHYYRRYGNLTDHPANDYQRNMVDLGIGSQPPLVRMAMEKAITFGVRYVEAYRYVAVDKNGGRHQRHYWRSGDPVYATDTDTPDGYARFKVQCFAKRDQERPQPTMNSKVAQTLVWDQNGGIVPRLRGERLPDSGETHPDICVGGSAVASETWRIMANGLLQFYLWGNGNQRIQLAASTLVKDPMQRELPERQELGSGECSYCHVSGVMYRRSDMALAKTRGMITNPEAATFWSDQDDIDALYREDARLFQNAIRTIVEGMSDNQALNDDLINFRREEPCYTTSGYYIRRM